MKKKKIKKCYNIITTNVSKIVLEPVMLTFLVNQDFIRIQRGL